MSLPLQNQAYVFYLTVGDSLNPDEFLASPTIAAGDFKVSTDGAALANLATLPVVTPAGSIWIKVSLSADEMDGEKVLVQGIDVAGAEWQQIATFIDVPTSNSETIADDVWDEPLGGHNTGGTTGKALKQVKEGTVSAEAAINDASPTTLVFATDLVEAVDDFYIDVSMVFINGALTGQSRTILSYEGATKTITLDEALTSPPADGDEFIIKTDHVHPVSQIVDGVWGPTVGETVAENVQLLTDIDQGDRTETNNRLIINKAGTLDSVLDKEITGSLLTPNVTIRTTDT